MIRAVRAWQRGVTLLIVAIAAAGSLTAFADQAAPGSSVVRPILSVSCTGQGQAATLRVRIVNQSDRDMAIVVGLTMADGKAHVLDSLYVITTRALTGADEDYAYVDPRRPAVESGVAPWIVSLSAGGHYALDVLVRQFLSRLNYAVWLDPAAFANARLVFEARPVRELDGSRGVPQPVPVWAGQLEAAIPRCD